MSHRYHNGSFAECSSRRRAWQRSRNLTNAWILGILRGDKEKRNRSHRKSNCKNFSLGKFKNKLSFYFFFFFIWDLLFYFTWHWRRYSWFSLRGGARMHSLLRGAAQRQIRLFDTTAIFQLWPQFIAKLQKLYDSCWVQWIPWTSANTLIHNSLAISICIYL